MKCVKAVPVSHVAHVPEIATAQSPVKSAMVYPMVFVVHLSRNLAKMERPVQADRSVYLDYVQKAVQQMYTAIPEKNAFSPTARFPVRHVPKRRIARPVKNASRTIVRSRSIVVPVLASAAMERCVTVACVVHLPILHAHATRIVLQVSSVSKVCAIQANPRHANPIPIAKVMRRVTSR